jgi:uncharacterized phage protein (TIGR01671 family)
MTREIKFRAWDGKNKFFVFAVLYNRIEMPFEAVNNPPKGKEWSFTAPTELIWQQYTGLKDKNNKEIYEGDILHFKTPDLVNLNYVSCVEWIEKGFWKDFINYEFAEIIGNIYENPKLLNPSK